MSVRKLIALTQFIEEQNLVDENQIDSWMEDGKLVPSSKNHGAGLTICRFQYDAVFSIECFSGDPALLMAMVSTWLMDFDPEREHEELPPPNIDVTVLDRDRSDVEFAIQFREDINIVEDELGPITFNNLSWRLDDVETDVALSAAVSDSEGRSTDQPVVS